MTCWRKVETTLGKFRIYVDDNGFPILVPFAIRRSTLIQWILVSFLAKYRLALVFQALSWYALGSICLADTLAVTPLWILLLLVGSLMVPFWFYWETSSESTGLIFIAMVMIHSHLFRYRPWHKPYWQTFSVYSIQYIQNNNLEVFYALLLCIIMSNKAEKELLGNNLRWLV